MPYDIFYMKLIDYLEIGTKHAVEPPSKHAVEPPLLAHYCQHRNTENIASILIKCM